MKVMFKTLVTRSILGLALLTATQSTCFGASKTIVTGLHAAIAAGNLELVKKLADKCPAALNTPGEDGRTALHYACMNDNEVIVRELLARGANPRIRDHKRTLSEYYAESTAIIELVLEKSRECEYSREGAAARALYALMAKSGINYAGSPT